MWWVAVWHDMDQMGWALQHSHSTYRTALRDHVTVGLFSVAVLLHLSPQMADAHRVLRSSEIYPLDVT